MKESGKERLKYVVYESTRTTLRVDFYKRRCPKVVGIAIRGKRISNIRGSQPCLAAPGSPFQRKERECGSFRVYRSLLPLEGGARRAEVGAQSGVKDDVEGKTFLHKSLLTRVPYPPLRGPPSPMENAN